MATVVIVVSAYGTVAALRWDREDLAASSDRASVLAEGELRAVTFNAWRLAQPARVPGLIDALRTTAEALGHDDERALPELIAIQEIESREAARALEEALAGTHEVMACECSQREDGSWRTGVAIAADRAFFDVSEQRCIALDRVWPDHPRCAAAMALERGETTLFAVGTHLAWHVDNSPMAERLRAELDAAIASGDPIVLMGDMNTWPGTRSHEILASAPLHDPLVDRAPTHFMGRIDYVLPRGLRVVRAVDQRALFDALRPSSALTLPRVCLREGPPACPVSDHLPEGVVLAL